MNRNRFKTNQNNTKSDLEDTALAIAEKLSTKIANGCFIVFNFINEVNNKKEKIGGIFKKWKECY